MSPAAAAGRSGANAPENLPVPPAEILALPHRSAQLPNGLKIYLVKYPSPGVVAYQLAVHAGSRNEIEKGKTGFAHFFEHLRSECRRQRLQAAPELTLRRTSPSPRPRSSPCLTEAPSCRTASRSIW